MSIHTKEPGDPGGASLPARAFAEANLKRFGQAGVFQHTICGVLLLDLVRKSKLLSVDGAKPDIVRSFAMAVKGAAGSAQERSYLRAVVATHVSLLRELNLSLESDQALADLSSDKIRRGIGSNFHELIERFRFDVKPRNVRRQDEVHVLFGIVADTNGVAHRTLLIRKAEARKQRAKLAWTDAHRSSL